jgi:hypothetical protein
MTKFYCLRFETPPTWRARFPYLYSPGIGWPSYTHRHWVLFLVTSYDSQGYCGGIRTHLLTGSELWALSSELTALTVLVITSQHGPHRKYRSFIVSFVSAAAGTCLPSRCPETGFLTPFIKNTLPQQRASFRYRYPATALHATIFHRSILLHITCLFLLVISRLWCNLHFKTFKSFKRQYVLYVRRICTLHVSTNISHLQMSIKLLIKLLCFRP